ncbi:alcohol dehydrogenase catalytic domain-containing protein [Sphingomonas sp. 22176]|uniref:alcohol dehydrogenase catalytic domain-containing protein n=1 Tax=Sphingomonas sp. 22176 TaxID=3453884 RepID=UPI003F842AA5
MAGICGSDLRHWEKPDQHLRCCIMGHGLAGEVVEVGAEVTRIQPGDRVLIVSVLGCGRCDWCQVQQYNRCPDLYLTRRASVSRACAEFVIGPSTRCKSCRTRSASTKGTGCSRRRPRSVFRPHCVGCPSSGLGSACPKCLC